MIGLQAPKFGQEMDEAKLYELQRFLDNVVLTLNNLQVLKMHPRTSDPTVNELQDGMVWFRSDLGVFRCYANGHTYTLDMTVVT
jgi:hypothetical protein